MRRSPVHGVGVFAARRIRKGTRIVEYLGDRITHREADRRYELATMGKGHTFLFVVDRGVVIDAGVDGNEARFINHGCNYDYSIRRDKDDPPDIDKLFACRCGTVHCRGTMLWPARRSRRRRPPRTGARRS